jgi:hypothetical protein
VGLCGLPSSGKGILIIMAAIIRRHYEVSRNFGRSTRLQVRTLKTNRKKFSQEEKAHSVTTNVVFFKEQHEWLRKLAHDGRTSINAVVRSLVRERMIRDRKEEEE